MNYNIKLYTHRVKIKFDDDLQKAISYFKKHGVNLYFDVEETPCQKQNVPLELFKINDGKYDVVMYMYDKFQFPAPDFGLTFHTTRTLRAIYLATTPMDDAVDYTWKSMCHEILHSLAYKFQMDKNLVIANLLDYPVINGKIIPYYKNEDLDALDGNFAQQWSLIKPFIEAKQPLQATLSRLYDYGKETVGKLVYGDFMCNTLELGYKANTTNISSIPKGTYKCVWSFSPKFMRHTYELLNVPGRSGIRIHSSNLYSQLMGCVALGRGYDNLDGDGLPDILNSRATMKLFEEKLGRKEFLLEIK